MPVAADRERELLNHYHITTLYPDTWPHSAADDSDDSDDFDDTEPHASSQPPSGGLTRQPSKLSARLTRHASIRSAGSLGPDSVVQKDEPDPLGTAPSVAAELRRRGLAVEDDLKLRNRFMLSSTSFSPALYLSQVHQDASTEELLRGLEFLGRSIEQKSASLKVLVESNFERFVKAKATIDNVYTEMRTQGQDESTAPLTPRPMSGRPGGGHSRQYSRSQPSTHFRTASGNTTTAFSPASVKNPGAPGSDKRQNALTKESEYGTLGIRTPLQDLTIKAEEVWGPTLGGREKEENVKSVLEALETHREVFRLPATLHEAIQRHDFDTVITSWTAAQRYADQARSLADGAKDNGIGLGDRDARHILLIAKMWADVSVQMDGYKRELWRRLKMNHGRKPAAVADETDKEEHLELTGVLLQLGVDENPIWEWLRGRHLYLKDKIVRSFERARVEIEVSRRRLAANDKQDGRQLAQYLRSASSNSSNVSALGRAKDETKEGDTPAVMHFWTLLHASLTHLLSSSSGILGEVLDFRSVTQSFIDGKAQKAFPPAVLNSPAAQEHLELEPEEVQNLRSAAIELMDLLRQGMLSFFADPPVEDLSELYSPLPPTPITPDLVSGPASPSQVRRVFSFDPTNAPPPSPKRGDSWEKFAFWPPRANSLSGSHHLARILALIGTAASELAGMPVVKQTRSGTEGLRTLVGAVRERVVQALCASWTADAEKFKYTETWHRSPERRDLTTMPANFMAFEESILVNFQKVAYVSEARGGGEQVIVSPPAKLLQAIRGTFVTSLYKILSGMVENAEKNRPRAAGEGDPDGVTVATMKALVGYESDGAIINGAVDASNRNIRLLLTLSNLSHLRADIIPHLISTFESSFSVKLTDESKTIRDVLGQIDARLFQSYIDPTIDSLTQLIATGISSPAWAPTTSRPDNARPYVYEVLLTLVLVHTEVSTTAASLTPQLLSYALESCSTALLHQFATTHSYYSLPALMQATLDVEFLAQTLNNFTTEKAGELQSKIYLALDERTDDDARKRLQGELPEMRGVLKRLREGTKGQFGCFRRERRGRGDTRVGREAGASRG